MVRLAHLPCPLLDKQRLRQRSRGRLCLRRWIQSKNSGTQRANSRRATRLASRKVRSPKQHSTAAGERRAGLGFVGGGDEGGSRQPGLGGNLHRPRTFAHRIFFPVGGRTNILWKK